MEGTQETRQLNRGIVAGIVAAAVMAMSALTLTACNTTEGAGKDIKSLGKGIEETAADAKE